MGVGVGVGVAVDVAVGVAVGVDVDVCVGGGGVVVFMAANKQTSVFVAHLRYLMRWLHPSMTCCPVHAHTLLNGICRMFSYTLHSYCHR